MAQVLVVDADPAVAGIIEFHLKRGGHQVVVARSAQDALASVAVGRETPDLAVLDVALPGMTGFELLEALRAVTGMAGLGAVFLSARTKPRRRRDGTAARGGQSDQAAGRRRPPLGDREGHRRPRAGARRGVTGRQARRVSSTTTSSAWADPPL